MVKLTQCKALAHTNEHTPTNEASNVSLWRESLEKGGDNDQ